MKIQIDDWRFQPRAEKGSVLAVDLFLQNGQRAILEVIPLMHPDPALEQIPEVVVKCEMPGEKPDQQPAPRRWLTRAPDPSCAWSNVELSETLIRQINERLSFAV